MNNLHAVYSSQSVQNRAQTVSTILDQYAKDMATICNYVPGVHKLESVWKLSPFPNNFQK